MLGTNMKKTLLIFLLCAMQSLWAAPYEGMREAIAQGDFGNIKAVIVSRHGEVIYEEYFRGTQTNTMHQVHSVTKSIGSALIGIAHRQGKIQLDQNLAEFFSDLYPMDFGVYADKQDITVEEVLQQRLGIEWDEWTLDYFDAQNPVYLATTSGDWYRAVLTMPMDSEPGEKFTYNTMGSTLMSRMIREASGQSPRNFALQELFNPLGISDIHWEGYSTQGMGNGLTDFPNPDGDEPLGFMLWLKARDMVKLGQLYLDGGVYNGRRILDQSWIDASWTNYSNSSNTEYFDGNPDSGYGYQWWATALNDDRDRRFKINYANGWGRQFIFVIPELDMVVVSVADDQNYEGPGIGTLLRTHILAETDPALDKRFSGSWYNPETNGQGINLEILDDSKRLVGYWYTFGASGERRWFTFDGDIEGSSANVAIIETTGGAFLQADPVSQTDWGTASFSVIDCDNMTFEINSEETVASVPLKRLTGSCSTR
jgi:CubicO group peptidase (beta-lactamase class C family)